MHFLITTYNYNTHVDRIVSQEKLFYVNEIDRHHVLNVPRFSNYKLRCILV